MTKKHRAYLAYQKAYRAVPAHKAKQKAYDKIRQATPEYRAQSKAYRGTPEHRAHNKAYQRVYHAARKQKAKRRVYLRTPRANALNAAVRAKRRALRVGALGHFTGMQLLALFAKYSNRCLRCNKKRRLIPDHVIPLSKRGSNYISNIQPLCYPCNQKKHNRTTDYR